MHVKDKVIIVTGASSGIGLATAKLLSQKGSKLVMAARSRDKLQQLSKQLPNSIPVVADMTKLLQIENMVKQAMEHFGRIDVLINNAGQGYDAYVENIDLEVFHYIFELDLIGPIVAMQQVIPIMRKQGGGAIVNISSGAAFMTLPGFSPYSCMKSALTNISLTATQELKAENIVVSTVYPYITATDFEKNTIKGPALTETKEEEEERSSAFAKADTAEYVAQKVLEAIETGVAELFAHDWMKNLRQKQT
jgi:short-subunit dehydrogenase